MRRWRRNLFGECSINNWPRAIGLLFIRFVIMLPLLSRHLSITFDISSVNIRCERYYQLLLLYRIWYIVMYPWNFRENSKQMRSIVKHQECILPSYQSVVDLLELQWKPYNFCTRVWYTHMSYYIWLFLLTTLSIYGRSPPELKCSLPCCISYRF